MSSSVGIIIPNIWKNQKYSKPPTSRFINDGCVPSNSSNSSLERRKKKAFLRLLRPHTWVEPYLNASQSSQTWQNLDDISGPSLCGDHTLLAQIGAKHSNVDDQIKRAIWYHILRQMNLAYDFDFLRWNRLFLTSIALQNAKLNN